MQLVILCGLLALRHCGCRAKITILWVNNCNTTSTAFSLPAPTKATPKVAAKVRAKSRSRSSEDWQATAGHATFWLIKCSDLQTKSLDQACVAHALCGFCDLHLYSAIKAYALSNSEAILLLAYRTP